MNIPKKGSRGRVILRRVVLALCGVILGLNLYMVNAYNLVGNQLPMPFGYGAAVVLSGSMEPTFSQGDLLIVQETEAFTEGDIVVYQDGIGLVVHRVVAMADGMITTRGDANNADDAPVALDAVKGKVLFWIGGAGHIVNFMKSPIGIVVILAAAVLLMELPWRNEKRQDEEERERILEEIRRLKEEQDE